VVEPTFVLELPGMFFIWQKWLRIEFENANMEILPAKQDSVFFEAILMIQRPGAPAPVELI